MVATMKREGVYFKGLIHKINFKVNNHIKASISLVVNVKIHHPFTDEVCLRRPLSKAAHAAWCPKMLSYQCGQCLSRDSTATEECKEIP